MSKDRRCISPYGGYERFGDIDFSGDSDDVRSRTQQHFAEEVEINNIVDRFTRTGVLGDPVAIAARGMIFGDFSNMPDFHSACNRVAKVREAFGALPADIRSRFNNDPGMLIDFLADPKNAKEALQLGLMTEKEYEVKVADAEAAAKAAADAKAAAETAAAAASGAAPAAGAAGGQATQ